LNVSVECITPGFELAYSQVYAINSGSLRLKREIAKDPWQINLDNYRRILSLRLQESGKENVLRAIRILERRDDVVSATPNFYEVFQHAIGDHDTFSSMRAHGIPSNQWGLSQIDAARAWGITRGSNEVIVGVMDTGIDANHNDLRSRLMNNLASDLTSENHRLTDPDGHGTHVAGTIAAQGGLSYGLAPNIRLVSLRVLYGNGRAAPVRYQINAIAHAIRYNIRILNFSGGGTSNDPDRLQAIKHFPGIFIASAGNDNRNNDTHSQPHFPSSHRLPNLISVGASDSNDNRARWGGILGINRSGSNYGLRTVCVFAPGVGIRGSLPDNRAGNLTGTSMAAPFVAGIAAMIQSVRPDLRENTKRAIIMQTVDQSSSFQNISVSGGRVNAYHAVRFAMGLSYGATWIFGKYITPGTYNMSIQDTQINL